MQNIASRTRYISEDKPEIPIDQTKFVVEANRKGDKVKRVKQDNTQNIYAVNIYFSALKVVTLRYSFCDSISSCLVQSSHHSLLVNTRSTLKQSDSFFFSR